MNNIDKQIAEANTRLKKCREKWSKANAQNIKTRTIFLELDKMQDTVKHYESWQKAWKKCREKWSKAAE